MLDPSQELPDWVSRPKLEQLLTPHSKTATDAAADFLIVVHETIQSELIKRFGETFVNQASIAYVLTVPAVWSDAAKQATVDAANKAGLRECSYMISEPEAAAVYALSTMKATGLTVGDVYIVLDAGGGTVDLITYQVDSLQPLRFKEVVPGSGHLCGSAVLNMRFELLVRNRLGAERFQQLQQLKPKTWAVAHDFFENYVKRNFMPSNDVNAMDEDEFMVPFPGVAEDDAAGIDSGFLLLTSAEVAAIFRPVLEQIITLVEHQRVEAAKANAPAKGVIMVGGFCQSPYLYSCLKQRFADGVELPPQYLETPQKAITFPSDLPPSYDQVVLYSRDATGRRPALNLPLAILQPENAWTAVVRGAVLRGLENKDIVSSRKARRHYGTVMTQHWDPLVHEERDKYWDDLTETWRANNQFVWFVKKGETMESGKAVLKDVCSDNEIRGIARTSKLYFCDADIAPTVYRAGPSQPVKRLCTVKIGNDQIPIEHYRTKRNSSGTVYYTLRGQLGFHVESGRLKFDVRVHDVVYGEVFAKFE